jgi:hypothetical protein
MAAAARVSRLCTPTLATRSRSLLQVQSLHWCSFLGLATMLPCSTARQPYWLKLLAATERRDNSGQCWFDEGDSGYRRWPLLTCRHRQHLQTPPLQCGHPGQGVRVCGFPSRTPRCPAAPSSAATAAHGCAQPCPRQLLLPGTHYHFTVVDTLAVVVEEARREDGRRGRGGGWVGGWVFVGGVGGAEGEGAAAGQGTAAAARVLLRNLGQAGAGTACGVHSLRGSREMASRGATREARAQRTGGDAGASPGQVCAGTHTRRSSSAIARWHSC